MKYVPLGVAISDDMIGVLEYWSIEILEYCGILEYWSIVVILGVL